MKIIQIDNEPMLEETSDEVLLEETSGTEAMLEETTDSEVLIVLRFINGALFSVIELQYSLTGRRGRQAVSGRRESVQAMRLQK